MSASAGDVVRHPKLGWALVLEVHVRVPEGDWYRLYNGWMPWNNIAEDIDWDASPPPQVAEQIRIEYALYRLENS
jgi:hypothetical protein